MSTVTRPRSPFLSGRRLPRSRLALWLVPAAALLVPLGLQHLHSGSLTVHMATHILLMNVAAPLLALAAVAAAGPQRAGLGGWSLVAASLVQMAVLWGAHAPPTLGLAMRVPGVHLLVQATLLAAAFGFWLAVLRQTGASRWRALAALLITAKLFCLLGVLLVFSPRTLYPGGGIHPLHPGQPGIDALADQQLAGLLMLVACPLSYLVAGVFIAALWLREISMHPPLPVIRAAPHIGP